MKSSMRIEGQAHGRFWARVFQLEDEMELARSQIDSNAPRGEFANVNVVSEHTVDDTLKFFYFLAFSVDRLGIKDVTGIIYMGDKGEWEGLGETRDKIADSILEAMAQKRPFDQVKIVESPKE